MIRRAPMAQSTVPVYPVRLISTVKNIYTPESLASDGILSSSVMNSQIATDKPNYSCNLVSSFIPGPPNAGHHSNDTFTDATR